LIAALCGALPVLAQVERASISGIITDKSNAALSGASVVVQELETGVKTSTVTNGSGNYYLSLLPGSYRLEVASNSFGTASVPKLTVTVAQAATFNAALELTSVASQVTVSDDTGLLEQENASLGATIESSKILQLPLLGRNPYSLVILAPNVIPKGNPGTGPLINGGRSNSNSVLLDGGQMLNSTTNDTNYTPPLESVEALKVQTSSFQAEYGRTAGGVINVTTKSGTNIIHGSLYEYFRNDDLNANTYSNDLAGLRKSVVRHNEFGGSLGGPVWIPKLYHGRDRTFFFVTWEGVPDRTPDPIISTVPTTAQRSGDFSKTTGANGQPVLIYDPYTTKADPANPGSFIRQPFPGNQIPASRIDPVAAKLMQYFPSPNAPGVANTGVNNFLESGDSSSAAHRFLIRLDHAWTDRNRSFIRYGLNTNDTTSNVAVNVAFPQQTSTANEPITENSYTAAIGHTITLRPNMIGEFRIGFTRDHKDSRPTSLGFDITQLGFSPSVAAAVRAQLFPLISITGVDPLGPATTAIRLSAQENRSTSGTMTWVTGRHTIKFGADLQVFRNDTYSPASPDGSYSFAASYTQGPNPTKASGNDGLGMATFLLGLPTSGSLTLDPALAVQQIYTGAFVQDTFKISKSLTLDVGLRWEATSPWQDRFNQLAYFSPSTPDAVTGRPGALLFVNGNNRSQTNSNLHDFGPRAGLAWQFAPKTVFRAGFGQFYAQGNRGVGAVSSELGQGFQTSTSVFLGAPSPITYAPPIGASFASPFVTGFNAPPSNLVGSGITTVTRNALTPVQNQWTASFQHQLKSDLVLEAAYSGSRGEHLWQDLPYNVAAPSNLALGNALAQQVPNPFYGIIKTGSLSAATVARSQLLQPFPQYGAITLHDFPVGDSVYHAVVLRADKRFSHGFTVLASFTGGKEIDNVGEHFSGRTTITNPYDLRSNRSLADYDVPQRLVVSYIWQLPFGPGQTHFSSGIWSKVVGAWQINGISSFQKGLPIVITAPNESGISGLTSKAQRLHSGVLSSGQTVDHWFDTTAFVPAAPFTLGSDSRTEPDLRGPGLRNFDVSISRNQLFRERINTQFRAEAFNVLNTPQLGLPDSSVTSPTFGRILSGSGNRALQLGLRISF
jgi:Carboxypeptidase regulatory-like domain/TonB dependent receptor